MDPTTLSTIVPSHAALPALDVRVVTDLPEDIDDELGACLSALMFFIDPAFGRQLLEDSGQPVAELPTFAQTLIDNFEGAMMGYAEIGRMVYQARTEN